MSALPGWCPEQLGAEPVGVLFRVRRISAVFGLRLGDGTGVVVKARDDDARWEALHERERVSSGNVRMVSLET